uniref:Uncharacterized protein n=1 Tax=Quercus lobata TaxID=97700 RepID=A0A7N2M2E1_QUELO
MLWGLEIYGSHFTSMMYIGYWCEEHFNSLILGSPDFSHNKMELRESTVPSLGRANDRTSWVLRVWNYDLVARFQAVFMMCAVASIDPCWRELVNAVLHNLSRQLKYTSMLKSLEELMGSILFCLVACGVSFALVEVM